MPSSRHQYEDIICQLGRGGENRSKNQGLRCKYGLRWPGFEPARKDTLAGEVSSHKPMVASSSPMDCCNDVNWGWESSPTLIRNFQSTTSISNHCPTLKGGGKFPLTAGSECFRNNVSIETNFEASKALFLEAFQFSEPRNLTKVRLLKTISPFTNLEHF